MLAAYAAPTITGEIQRHFRDRTWIIRIPRRLKDLNAAINKTVAELTAPPVRHRDILVMPFFHEMAHTQIAEQVGVSQMQISRQPAAILAQLRDALDPHTPPPGADP